MRHQRRQALVGLGILALASSVDAGCFNAGRCYLLEAVPAGTQTCELSTGLCPTCVQMYSGNLWCSRVYFSFQCLPGFEHCPVAPPSTPKPSSPLPTTHFKHRYSDDSTESSTHDDFASSNASAHDLTATNYYTSDSRTDYNRTSGTRDHGSHACPADPPSEPSLDGNYVLASTAPSHLPAIMKDTTPSSSSSSGSRTESASLPDTAVHSTGGKSSSSFSITTIAAGVGACTVFIFVVIFVRFRRRQDWEASDGFTSSKLLASLRATVPGTFLRSQTPVEIRSSPYHSVTPVMESQREIPIM
ncbi:hypothetical protein ACHHYP_10495 [Achlya hypogyna]|uniref:Secreted protein n=1 Tax=Achlya hypogyna TaxID=1202772 RepID=A0A1V9YLA0_ACHHY|nr:hypothetical protein ACHHYP_10495 [Achlya hypogyna]